MSVKTRIKDLFTSKKKKAKELALKTPELELSDLAKIPVVQEMPIEEDAGFEDIAESEDFKKIQTELDNLTLSELAAKSAYLLSSSDPMQVEYTKQKLAEKGYTVHTILPSTDDLVNEQARSIYIYALVPADTNEPAIIACRGTEFSDIYSAMHNVDPKGPAHGAIMPKDVDAVDPDGQAGEYVVIQEKRQPAQIILSDIAEKCGKHSKLRITGHSQGGSISQLIYTQILEQKALQEESEYAEAGDSYLPKLSDLSLQAFQSAGVNDDICERANTAAKKVADLGVHLSADYFVRSWDVVPLSGSKILVSESVSPEIAKVSLTRVTQEDHKKWFKFDRKEDFSLKSGVDTAKEVIKNPSPLNIAWQFLKKLGTPLKRQMAHVALESHTKTGFLHKESVVLKDAIEEPDYDSIAGIVQDYQEDAWGSFNTAGLVEQYTNETPKQRKSMTDILNRDLVKMDRTGLLGKARELLHKKFAGKSKKEAMDLAVATLGGPTMVTAMIAGTALTNHLYSGSKGIYTAYDAVRSADSLSTVVRGLDGVANALEAGEGLVSGARRLMV